MIKENRNVLILIFLAYVFSYLFHIYWISWASNYPQFFFHNQLMINNVDGYFYGSAAQKIVEHLHEYNPRLEGVYHYGTAVITAYLAKFFHISIDNLMLYLPAIISSLVVVPIILIGKLYEKIEWGFLSALIGSIGWSYYNRTLAGYYDTDMFSAMLPMLILYFILASIKNRSLTFILLGGVTTIFYPWAYDQGLSIVYAMGILAFLYLLIFHFKDEFTYKFIAVFSIALMDINWVIRVVGVLGVFYFLKNKKVEIKNLQILSGLLFLGFFITGNVFGIILAKVLSYATSTQTVEGLHYLNVSRTVSEAGHIPWNIVFDRIIGSSVGLVISVIGYILLVKRYKEFIIALPLWGIGFFAFVGGLRFTIYAVPIAAISGVYFFVWLATEGKIEKVKWQIKEYSILIVGTLFLLAPNISHIVGCCEKNLFLDSVKKIYPLKSSPYLTLTTFNKSEVEILDKLNKVSNSKDYVITWWDYGYPIWYYADVNTLIDGGKHNEDNFLVSKILTTDNQKLAANLSKISIKKYVETNTTVAPQLFTKNGKPIDVNHYLNKIGNKNLNVKLDRNVYLMLPYRMFNILPTIAYFSNRNLNNGNVYRSHFFYKGDIKQKGNYLLIGQVALDLKKGVLLLGQNRVPVKTISVVKYSKSGKLIKGIQKISPAGLNVIIMSDYRSAIVVDDDYFNSTFIQMFVFENYDKNLFEPVILNPMMKIYKIK